LIGEERKARRGQSAAKDDSDGRSRRNQDEQAIMSFHNAKLWLLRIPVGLSAARQ
jgi:hypothetical protein